MAGKTLSVKLNKNDQMLISEVSTILGKPDRSEVVKLLAIDNANRLIQQFVQERIRAREEQESKASENNGDAGSDIPSPSNSDSTDSNVHAEPESTEDKNEGSAEPSGV